MLNAAGRPEGVSQAAKNINQPHHCTGSNGTHCWEQHRQWAENTCKLLLIWEAANPYNHCQVRAFFPLCISSSDLPANDKVLADFKRTQQDWAEKELKKEMPSESLVGGEKNRIVSSLYSFKINSATDWRNPFTLVKMEQ